MSFKKTTLDNGLEIIAEINEAALSTSLGFFVRTGGRDETDEISGVSHFLEHMVFKGTDRRTAMDVNRELDVLGGNSNACTSEESTAFYAKTLPDLHERAIDLLSDILRPALRKEDFDMEKQVILEEIKMYEDQPPFLINERSREFFFAGHPLSRFVLGTRESIGGLTPEMMREYFERRYSPSNVVFAACGQLDFDRIVRWVDSSCGKWKNFDTSRETWRAKGRSGVQVLKRDETAQEYVLQLVDAPAASDEERFAASVLATILGGSVGSRFFWELIDSGRADLATLSSSSYSDSGYFETALACNPEDVDDNLLVMREILLDAQKNGVTEEELARAKTKLCTAIALSAEHPMTRLFAIGEEWLTNGKYYSVADDLKIVRDLTPDDLSDVMQKYPFDNPFTIAVGELESLRDYR
jgi:predicted Zn-dependent peptidase